MRSHNEKDEVLPVVATLRDGRRVSIRPIRPADKAEFAAAFERLCAESRYARFFSAMASLPEKMLVSATNPIPGSEIALVACSAEAGRDIIVGGARCVFGPGSNTCEFAVTVADDWRALGLARAMMEVLIRMTRAGGGQRMEGFVVPANSGMRRLAARLGFVDSQCPDDPTLRLVTLEL